MANIISMLGDIVLIVFCMLVYMRLTALKKDTRTVRILMYVGAAVIFACYCVSAYVFEIPVSVASFLCMSLPSFVFFWLLSKYKDARFFVTFCFVDTVTLIIGFFARAIGIGAGQISAQAGNVGSIVACVVTAALCLTVYLLFRPYFSAYRTLLDNVKQGWWVIMISTCIVYVLLIFGAAYPKPLAERLEYLPVYALISLAILSFYVVLIMCLFEKKSLYALNLQLEEAHKWHKIAKYDALTNLKNRMSYMEYINHLERTVSTDLPVHMIVIDLDDFKTINDTLGHHVGDQRLQQAAAFLAQFFAGECYELFRIGGDEFAVVSVGVEGDTVLEKIHTLNRWSNIAESGASFSAGCALVDHAQNNCMENAYIVADRAMYRHKQKKKEQGEIES